MTLDEFIESLVALQALGHGALPVAIHDWNEEYATPNADFHPTMAPSDGQFVLCKELHCGPFIEIG